MTVKNATVESRFSSNILNGLLNFKINSSNKNNKTGSITEQTKSNNFHLFQQKVK